MAERNADLRSASAFVALMIGCGALIAGTAALTGERIEENRARRFLTTLTELTGSAAAAAEIRWSDDVAHLCPDRALLRGTARGYGGTIHWLAAVDVAGPAPALERLRITAHQETPGIADFVDRPAQGWMAALEGRGAAQLAAVDAVSGATITSRALTRSLAEALPRAEVGHRPECAP